MKNFWITIITAISIFTNSFAFAEDAKVFDPQTLIPQLVMMSKTYQTTEELLEHAHSMGLATSDEVQKIKKHVLSQGITTQEKIGEVKTNKTEVSIGQTKVKLIDQQTIRTASGKAVRLKLPYETFDQSVIRLSEEISNQNLTTQYQNLFFNTAVAKESELSVYAKLAGVGLAIIIPTAIFAAVGLPFRAYEEAKTFFKCSMQAPVILSKEEEKNLNEFIAFGADQMAEAYHVTCKTGKSGKPYFQSSIKGANIGEKFEYAFLTKLEKCTKKINEAAMKRKEIGELVSAQDAETEQYQKSFYHYAFNGKATICNDKTAKTAENNIKEAIRINRVVLSIFIYSAIGHSPEVQKDSLKSQKLSQ
jgi:hypothetical protein